MTEQNNQSQPEGLSQSEKKQIEDLIDFLMELPESVNFLQPVDYVALGLPDYPTIIQHPMDLSTAKQKLQDDQYSSVSEAIGDVGLIWQNCRDYNVPGSLIVQQANTMDKQMKRYCKKNKISIDDTANRHQNIVEERPQNGISFDEKLEFAEKIRKVSHEVLGDIILLIQQECPHALEDVDKERMQIVVDSLQQRTFFKILQQVLCRKITRYLENPSEPYKRIKK